MSEKPKNISGFTDLLPFVSAFHHFNYDLTHRPDLHPHIITTSLLVLAEIFAIGTSLAVGIEFGIPNGIGTYAISRLSIALLFPSPTT